MKFYIKYIILRSTIQYLKTGQWTYRTLVNEGIGFVLTILDPSFALDLCFFIYVPAPSFWDSMYSNNDMIQGLNLILFYKSSQLKHYLGSQTRL